MKKTLDALIVQTIALIIFPVICGMIAISFGQKITWDLLSYHYYNGYAFIKGRLGYDIAPVGIQTFLNPALDTLFYLGAQCFSPKQVQFVLGFIQGFNLSLLFLIFWETAHIPDKRVKVGVGISLAVIALLGPGFLLELGNTGYDNVVSIFVLFALLFFFYAKEQLEQSKSFSAFTLIGIAGLALGIGTGLKLVVMIYVIGMVVALLFFIKPWKTKIVIITIIGVSGVIGILVSSGFWFYTLWSNFQNPLFPFYNEIFKSAYISSGWHFTYYESYIPSQLWQYLVWPLVFSLDSSHVIENPFIDIRFGLVYFICLIIIARRVIWKVHDQMYNHFLVPENASLLLWFSGVSFFIWMIMFSYYRFLLTLEILLPIILLILIERFSASNKVRAIFASFMVALIFLCFRPNNISGGPWSDRLFEVDPTSFPSTDNTTVIMLGSSPMGYVIPSAPPQLRFVRPDWNYVPENQQGLLYRQTKNFLKRVGGPVYVLYNEGDFASLDITKSLNRFDLIYHPEECSRLKKNTADILILCKVSRKSH